MMKSYQQFLLTEGGNISFGDISAERIDLNKINRDEIVPHLKTLIHSINKEFKKQFKQDLWKPELIESGKFLSGSAFHFFNLSEIPTETFTKFKHSVGDIDTQVDIEKTEEIEKFLESSVSKKIGHSTLLGVKKTFAQFITLWAVPINKESTINLQIDLELVEYKDGVPSEWANFSHSSHWDDISKSIKGVFHKLLLRAISDKDKISFIERMKTKDKVVQSNIYSLSVGKGLRKKYVPVLDDSGKLLTKDGMMIVKAVATKDSHYETDLSIIFTKLFDKQSSVSDLKQFESFTGLLKLIKKYLKPEQIDNTIERFVNLMFDEKAQGIYKDDPEQDKKEKMTALTLLCKTFNKNIEDFEEKISTYYKNYKS